MAEKLLLLYFRFMISTALAQKLCRLYFRKQQVFKHIENLLQVNVLKSTSLTYAIDYDRLARIEELILAKKSLETTYKALAYFFDSWSPKKLSYLREFAFWRSDKGFYGLAETDKTYKAFKNAVLTFRRQIDIPFLSATQLETAEEFIL